LNSDGHDATFYLQGAAGSVTLSSYKYSGVRPLGNVADRFWRQGFGLSVIRGRLTLDNVIQTGFDSSAFGTGSGASSSGGFSQLRYAFSRKSFAIARLDGTRFIVEDMLTHFPQTKNALNTQFTVAS
jgi:hypothetical protein